MGGSKPPIFDTKGTITQATQANQAAAQHTQQFSEEAFLKSLEAQREAARTSQSMKTIGQDTPYGTLDYETSIDPITGAPKYKAVTRLSPEQQAILNKLQQNQLGAGQVAGGLMGSSFGRYLSAPDLIGGANSLTQKALDSMIPAWERFHAPEREMGRTHALNAGLIPGTPAYNKYVDRITQQQDLDRGQWMANFTPQAFGMAKTNYENPLEIFMKLAGFAQPGSLKTNLIGTPTTDMSGATMAGATEQAPDVAGISKTGWEAQKFAYEQEQAKKNAMMGMFTGAAGAAFGAPVSGENMTFGGQALKNIFLK